MKPDFVLAGESRCGSTALYERLIRHPDIGLPTVDTQDPFKYDNGKIDLSQKELRFFDRHWDKGIDWYFNRFQSSKIIGDASATYLFEEVALRRIKETMPDIKLIVLLRNPVDRLISHYHHIAKIQCQKPDFDRFINEFDNQNHMVKRGIYVDSMTTCFKYFDPSKVLVIKSEDLFKDTGSLIESIFSFLGLPNHEGEFKKFRSSNPAPCSAHTRKTLEEFYSPYNNQLYEYLNRNMDW